MIIELFVLSHQNLQSDWGDSSFDAIILMKKKFRVRVPLVYHQLTKIYFLSSFASHLKFV